MFIKIIKAAFFPACILPMCLLRSLLAETLWAPISPDVFPSLQRDGSSSSKRKIKNDQEPSGWTYRQNGCGTNSTNCAETSGNLLLVMIALHSSWWEMWCMDKENLTECNTCKRKLRWMNTEHLIGQATCTTETWKDHWVCRHALTNGMDRQPFIIDFFLLTLCLMSFWHLCQADKISPQKK